MNARNFADIAADKLTRLAKDLENATRLGFDPNAIGAATHPTIQCAIAESRREAASALERLAKALEIDDTAPWWIWRDAINDWSAVADHREPYFTKRAAAWRAFADGAS